MPKIASRCNASDNAKQLCSFLFFLNGTSHGRLTCSRPFSKAGPLQPDAQMLQASRYMLARLIQHVRSRLVRLFKFDHLADARLLAHLQLIQIDSSSDGLALLVPAIPNQPVFAHR